MSALKALSGETYTTRTSSGSVVSAPSRTRSSIAVRNAASVLPDPVGAAMSVWRRARMAAQPCACAAVGVPSVSENQRATVGWKEARTTLTKSNHVLPVCRHIQMDAAVAAAFLRFVEQPIGRFECFEHRLIARRQQRHRADADGDRRTASRTWMRNLERLHAFEQRCQHLHHQRCIEFGKDQCELLA